MEIETIFKNAGEPWSPEEDIKLNKLYNEDMLDIIEISKIHNRAPGGIISRLILRKYITHRQCARGYDIYKNSIFYKQSVITNKDNYKKDLTEKLKQSIENKPLDNGVITINKNDYIELQNDVKEMKNIIKELVEMIKAVYEFEEK